MKKIIIVFSLIIFGAFSLMAQKEGEKTEKKAGKKERNEKQVQQNEKKLVMFYKKGLSDSIASMYTNNCYFAHEYMTRLESQDDVRKKIKADFKAGLKVTEMVFKTDDLKSYGDIILETGILTLKVISPGNTITVEKKYNYNLIWKESSDKKYRIRSEIWTPIEKPCK